MAKKAKEKCPHCGKEFANLNRHKCKEAPVEDVVDKKEPPVNTNAKKPIGDDQRVFVGKKPMMNYVTAMMMVLGKGLECAVLARGKAISKAVDACEVLKNRFMSGTDYGDIRISTEERDGERGKSNVSAMEIVLIPQVTAKSASTR